MYKLEPNVFPTVFDGIWWAFITLTTVGYGDFVPATFSTRLLSMVFILIGIGYMSYLAFALAEKTFSLQKKRKEGKMKFVGENHFIIVGWNERARGLIHNLRKKTPSNAIVLIDGSIDKLPLSFSDIYFIRGFAYEDLTMKNAHVQKAKHVFLTANNARSEETADKDTVISILTLKGISPNTYCTAEILTMAQLKNAKRAGADQIVQSNTLIHETIMRCANRTHFESQ